MRGQVEDPIATNGPWTPVIIGLIASSPFLSHFALSYKFEGLGYIRFVVPHIILPGWPLAGQAIVLAVRGSRSKVRRSARAAQCVVSFIVV